MRMSPGSENQPESTADPKASDGSVDGLQHAAMWIDSLSDGSYNGVVFQLL